MNSFLNVIASEGSFGILCLGFFAIIAFACAAILIGRILANLLGGRDYVANTRANQAEGLRLLQHERNLDRIARKHRINREDLR